MIYRSPVIYRPFLYVGLLILVVFPSFSLVDASTDVKLYPVADCYISSSRKNDNFGGLKYLSISRIQGQFSEETVAFIQFDLPNVTLNNQIRRVSVNLHTNGQLSSAAEIGMSYFFGESWNEERLTWSNKPLYEAPSNYYTVTQGDSWYVFTIDNVGSFQTRLLNAQKVGDSKLTVVLSPSLRSTVGPIFFSSRDQIDSLKTYQSYLSIQFDAPSQSEISCTVASSTTLGRPITVSGYVQPSISTEVTLNFFSPDGRTMEKKISSNPGGFYFDSFSPDTVGRWYVQASWKEGSNHDGVLSPKVVFDVVELTTKSFLNVKVFDREGNRIEGASVLSLNQPESQTVLASLSNSEGVSTFSNILSGNYTFEVKKPGYNNATLRISVNPGKTISQSIQLIRLVASIKLVTTNTKGVSLSGVILKSIEQPDGQLSLSGSTSSLGSVVFSDVKPGNYTFEASRSGLKTTTVSLSLSYGKSSEKIINLESEIAPLGPNGFQI